MKYTPLYQEHLSLGAKLTPFAGWMMPVKYREMRKEHLHVRSHIGIFDVSHMGCIYVEGVEALKYVNYIGTAIVSNELGRVTYSVITNSQGKAVDDVLIYTLDKDCFLLVVNAGNREKDWEHLTALSTLFSVRLSHTYSKEGIIALQGPNSLELIKKLFPQVATLSPMHCTSVCWMGASLLISRTGYTGEKGVEMILPYENILSLWRLLIEQGGEVWPIGLAARDTLRLEKGFVLYGNELSEKISPVESVAAWTLSSKKGDFLGKEAIESIAISQKREWQYPVVLEAKGVPREGYPIFSSTKEEIGRVTSGTFSPCLEKGIALIQVQKELEVTNTVYIGIRGRHIKGRIVALPFVKRGTHLQT